MMSRELHSILRWVTMTPFGEPVEPDVNISAARSRSAVTWGKLDPGFPKEFTLSRSVHAASPNSSAHGRARSRKRFEIKTLFMPVLETISEKVFAETSV